MADDRDPAALWESAVDRLRATGGEAILVGMLDHVAFGGRTGSLLTLEVAGEVTERRVAARVAELPALLRPAIPWVEGVELRRVPSVDGTPHQRRLGRDAARSEAMRAELANHPLVVALQQHLGGVAQRVNPTGESGEQR